MAIRNGLPKRGLSSIHLRLLAAQRHDVGRFFLVVALLEGASHASGAIRQFRQRLTVAPPSAATSW